MSLLVKKTNNEKTEIEHIIKEDDEYIKIDNFDAIANTIDVSKKLLEDFGDENLKLKEEVMNLQNIVDMSKQTLLRAKHKIDEEQREKKILKNKLKKLTNKKVKKCTDLEKYIKSYATDVSEHRKKEIIELSSKEWNKYLVDNGFDF